MKTSPTQKTYFVIWAAISIGLLIVLFSLLSDSDRNIAWRTLSLGILTSCIAVPIGVLLAWVASGKGTIVALVRTFCIVGVLLPVFTHVSAWDAAFGKLGLLTNTFGDVLKPLVSRWPAAVWIHAMIASPQVAVLLLVAYRSGSQGWEDALRLETSATGTHFRILVWRFLPVIAAAVLWTMISCAREIGVTDIYQIGTLSEQVYLGYSLGQLNAIGAAWTPQQLLEAQNLGTGITLVVVAWLAASAMFAFFAASRCVEQNESRNPVHSGPNSVLANVIGMLLLLLVVAIPVGNLIGRVGFYVTKVDGEPVATWDAVAAIEAIKGVIANFQDEFIWSFLIAAVSTTIVSAVAMLLVWYCKDSLNGKIVLGLIFGVLAALPGPSIGLFVGKVFSQFDLPLVQYLYDRTIAAPVHANVLFCLPLAIPIFWFLAQQISKDQQEAATLEGASRWQQFVHFGLVGNWRLNLGAWFLVAALSFGELSATQMVLPPGMDSVPRLALGMLHAGVNESTAALTLVTLIPVFLFAFMSQICFAKTRRSVE